MLDGVVFCLNMFKVIVYLYVCFVGIVLIFYDDIVGIIIMIVEWVVVNVGDIVLLWKDFLGSYYLFVVLDDVV